MIDSICNQVLHEKVREYTSKPKYNWLHFKMDIKTTDGLLVSVIGVVYWFSLLFTGFKLFNCWWNWILKRSQPLRSDWGRGLERTDLCPNFEKCFLLWFLTPMVRGNMPSFNLLRWLVWPCIRDPQEYRTYIIRGIYAILYVDKWIVRPQTVHT